MREPVVYVEIDQDICACVAAGTPCLMGNGQPSFGTLATCGDPESFTLDSTPLTLRFCKPHQPGIEGVYAIPSIESVTTAPTVINPGNGSKRSGPLGQRAVVRVTFQDAPGSDNIVDPYVDQRGYNPLTRGTWWSKWLVRNPYYQNRKLRVYEGYVGQTLQQMQVRHYLIDAIDGPDARGNVTVIAKDVLKLADNDRAVAPKPSPGELINDLNDSSTTSIDVTGAGISDYPAPGTVRINREMIRYTGRSAITNGARLTGITRHTDGTEAMSHKAGDRVQLCLRYHEARVDDMVYDWLVNYGDVDPAYIDTQAWADEVDLWLQQYDLIGLLTEPTGVTDLLREITEQCLFYIWWDEREQKIKLEAIKPPIFDNVPEITEDKNIIADSLAVKDNPSARISQVWVFWDQRDPTEKLDKEDNYTKLRVRADLEAEADVQYGDKRIKKIYSRWLHTEGQAINVTTRLLNRFRDTPKTMSLDLDAKDRGVWTGAIVDVETRQIVDFTGLAQFQRWQVLSAEEIESGHRIRYQLESFEFKRGGPISGQWMDTGAPTYDQASPVEKLSGAWWARADGKMDDDNAGYTWT